MNLADLRQRIQRRRGDPDESGVSIVELVISMLIFSVVLGIYFGALISMAQTTARAKDSVDASDALRSTFNSMESQVRFATSINRPVKGTSGSWYIEFESTQLPNSQPAMCYQWKFDPTAKTVSYRTWTENTSTVTAWHGVAWEVQAIGSGSPFAFAKATSTILAQKVTVSLQALDPKAEVLAQQSTSFVARNSSMLSPTNDDTNGDGVSDSQVCIAKMNRP